MKRLFPVFSLLSCLIAANSLAGSATWSSNPISGDWNTAENWMPNTVPNSPTDVATFETSAVTDVSIVGVKDDVGSVVFNPGADSFSLNVSGVFGQSLGYLNFDGDGVVNNSGKTQQFTADRKSVV